MTLEEINLLKGSKSGEWYNCRGGNPKESQRYLTSSRVTDIKTIWQDAGAFVCGKINAHWPQRKHEWQAIRTLPSM